MREQKDKKKQEETKNNATKAYEINRKKRVSEEAAKIIANQSMGSDGGGGAGVDFQKDDTYMQRRNTKLGLPPQDGRNLKVTLEDLERMNY